MESQSNSLVDKIYQLLKHQIKSQLYQPHQKIPSIRKLSTQYNVSKNTIISVFNKLMDEDLIYSKPASGYFVMQQKKVHIFQKTNIEVQEIDELWLMRRQLENFNDILNLGDGFPDKLWFEQLPLNKLLLQSIQKNNTKLLRYGSKFGYEPLRKKIALNLLYNDIVSTPKNILLTNGVNDALDLIIRYFIETDTVVIVDSPVYYPLLKKLQLSKCSIYEVDRQQDGPDCEMLEQILKHKTPKLFFTQSVAHNPTGTDISHEKIAKINYLCKKYDCLIVENDIFSEYTDQKNRLSSQQDFSNHIYIGGFSKIISPSIRVGFIIGDPYLIDHLADFKAILHVNSSEYSERSIYTILQDKSYQEHLKYFRENLHATTNRAIDNLNAVGAQIFHIPKNSIYCWVSFENLVFNKETINTAIENHLVFAPGHIFSINGDKFNAWTRINLSVAADEKFESNMHNLMSAF